MNTSPKSCPRCTSSPESPRARRASDGLRALASLPGGLLPLVPSFSCPACITAYAGVLSALGLGFLFTERVLLPLIALSLVLGLASIAWTVRLHGQKAPLVLAGAAGLLIASGRLVWALPLVAYLGAAGFLLAAGWNLWLRLRMTSKEHSA
jgi:hypothetical protein